VKEEVLQWMAQKSRITTDYYNYMPTNQITKKKWIHSQNIQPTKTSSIRNRKPDHTNSRIRRMKKELNTCQQRKAQDQMVSWLNAPNIQKRICQNQYGGSPRN
jgi:hypothetical protein